MEMTQPLTGVTVLKEYPPIFDEIEKAFPAVHGKNVLYCWGRIIYNPQGVDIAPHLYAHEGVHCGQQGDDIRGWWRRYIDEPEFRLRQEIAAHRAEYLWMAENGNRVQRRMAMKAVAKKLAAPLYGNMITPSRALTLIKEGMAA